MATRKVLVSLDCLLDTRLGTLAKLDPRYRDKILNEKTPYFDRVLDEFEWLEEGLTVRYKEAYKTRDVETLSASFLTKLVPYLKLLTASVLLDGGDGPVWDSVSFEVNYFPYVLSDEQLDVFAETIQECLTGYDENNNILFSPEVRMVSVPIEELSFDRLKKKWDAVYLYEFEQWTDAQAESMKDPENEMLAAQIELHVPTLFREATDKETLRLPDGGFINPFKETKRMLSLWINVVFTHPRFFSIIDPFDPDR